MPLAVADGGTGASDLQTARVNLGLDKVDNVGVRDSWIQNEGHYIATDRLRARDANGLALVDKDGSGLFVEDGGHVGIGTTTPTEKLEVAGAVKAAAFVGDGSQLTGVIAGKWLDPEEEAGAIYYTAGNVGIGTTEPGALLDVVSHLDGNAATLRLQNQGDGDTALGLFDKGGVLKAQIAYQPATDALHINDEGTDTVLNAHGGNVAIGDGKLAIQEDGAIYLYAQNLVLENVPDAPGFLPELYIDDQGRLYKQPRAFPGTPSSRRFKENIQPFEANFNLLKAVPRTFTYTQTGEQSMGFIAEELHALGLHHLVHCDQNDQPRSVEYDKVSVYVLEIVKAQQKLLKKLKRIVRRQKGKLAGLNARMAQIEAAAR